MRISLPYPHKALWPNGRPHWAEKARETKKHRQWAALATQEAMQRKGGLLVGDGPYAIKIIVYGESRGVLPDKDGCVTACKAMLDGIADALGVNDRHFEAPVVEYADKREGRFVIEMCGQNS